MADKFYGQYTGTSFNDLLQLANLVYGIEKAESQRKLEAAERKRRITKEDEGAARMGSFMDVLSGSQFQPETGMGFPPDRMGMDAGMPGFDPYQAVQQATQQYPDVATGMLGSPFTAQQFTRPEQTPQEQYTLSPGQTRFKGGEQIATVLPKPKEGAKPNIQTSTNDQGDVTVWATDPTTGKELWRNVISAAGKTKEAKPPKLSGTEEVEYGELTKRQEILNKEAEVLRGLLRGGEAAIGATEWTTEGIHERLAEISADSAAVVKKRKQIKGKGGKSEQDDIMVVGDNGERMTAREAWEKYYKDEISYEEFVAGLK